MRVSSILTPFVLTILCFVKPSLNPIVAFETDGDTLSHKKKRAYMPYEKAQYGPSWKFMISEQFGFGHNFINKDNNFSTSFTNGIDEGGLYAFAPYFGWGFSLGTSYTSTYINKHASFHEHIDIDHERYIYWDFHAGTFIRFSFEDLYDQSGDMGGFFIDLGARYSLPLIFRHVVVDGNVKTKTKGIHQFTDISAYARIGYEPFTLFAEYRITNYLKDPYFEQPQLHLGIAFTFLE